MALTQPRAGAPLRDGEDNAHAHHDPRPVNTGNGNGATKSQSIRAIEPELLLQELRSGRSIIVLDIRPSVEFRGPTGRIAGAWSIPLHQLAARSGELLQHKYDRIVVVARTDASERTAALNLELLGFGEVQTLFGGMDRWLELGLPVVHATLPP